MKNDELAKAAGYRVETRDGRIGSIAAVLPPASGRGSAVLLVHSGLMSCKLTAIPVDQVEAVDVPARRVLLHDLPKTMGSAAPSGARDQIVDRA
jgi:hypothetical protein